MSSTPAPPRGNALFRITPLHVLLVVAILEVAIDRVLVPMLAPEANVEPSTGHTILAFFGLFLMYFTGVLAAIVGLVRCVSVVRTGTRVDFAAHAILGIAIIFSTLPLFASMPSTYGVLLEIGFGAAVFALPFSTLGRDKDRGIQIGVAILAVPLLLHVASALGSAFVWPDEVFDGPGVQLAQIGVLALAIAALATPYCFAPRPFSRAVTKPVPVIAAMAIAAMGAVISRILYPTVAKAAAFAIGVELNQSAADPRLALYLLAIATLIWTLVSAGTAPSPARRRVAIGIALVILGGHGFKWPNHYLLPLVGLALIVEAARVVREEELAHMPLTSVTPPIADAAWSGYVSSVSALLKRTIQDVHSLTARGDGGMTSSLVVGEVDGLAVRCKVERIDGSVLALDVTIGREVDETTPATLVVWGVPERGQGSNPAGPPAEPAFVANDPAFDAKFRVRGASEAFDKLFDSDTRARAVTGLTGWLAYWQGQGLRYRVYPGHGAGLDHPIPLQDLALGRVGAPERLGMVIELLVELGRRGL